MMHDKGAERMPLNVIKGNSAYVEAKRRDMMEFRLSGMQTYVFGNTFD